MAHLFYLALAALLGAGQGLQVTLLGALGRQRGPLESSWTSLLATVTTMAAVLALRAGRGVTLRLPAPFDRPLALALVASVAAVGLFCVLRGVAPYFVVTGMLAVPYLFGVAFLAPRLGVALLVSAVITGQMLVSLLIDHYGALGVATHRLDAPRLGGAILLVAGVVLVRGVRS